MNFSPHKPLDFRGNSNRDIIEVYQQHPLSVAKYS